MTNRYPKVSSRSRDTIWGVDTDDFQAQAQGLINDRSLGYDQKLRRLSALAVNSLLTSTPIRCE